MRKHDLTSLQLFVLVCDTRNIARAAEQAHMVSSAISKRLVQLEEAFGTQLLVRQRYGVMPTAAGETLLEHARAVLDALRRIDRDMGAHASGIRGHVRVFASASVMAENLAEDVSAFLQDPAHRGIQLDVEERTSPEVVRGVREGNAALGLCWEATDMQGLSYQHYRTDHLAIVVPRGHPLANRGKVAFEDTLDYEHVGMPPPNAVKGFMLRAAAIAGKSLNYRVVVGSFEALLKVVNAGLAIGVLPSEFALPATKDAAVAVVELTNPWATRRFVVCHRDRDSLAPAASLLAEFLSRREAPAARAAAIQQPTA
jgi:DNA-binding transcriptional LysR family regulator